MKSSPPPALRKILLIDDNDNCAEVFIKDFQSRGTEVVRVSSATEAIELFNGKMKSFDGIVTDITMETQHAGLRILHLIKKSEYRGIVTVTSTAFNTAIGLVVTRFLLKKFFHCHYLIPKRPLFKAGKVIWLKVD
jgi:CheY-like chemotaxis protein